MKNAQKKSRVPSYGNGFDGISGLVPDGTSHRWFHARRLVAAPGIAGTRRP